MTFPKDFLWGAATASYQIEGHTPGDGRGECIWQRFSRTPGKVANGDTGERACDHYHRYQEDVALMRQLGLEAYRFSTSWARVLPSGTGKVNQTGLDFYSRLVDALLEAGIQPFLTLYHWDLPQTLQDRGGWASPESVTWFSEYTELMTRALGDRVKSWTTINEPWVIAFLGNWLGIHAPGLTDLRTAYHVAHNLMLAHAAAVPVIRANVADAQAGITVDLTYMHPATSKPEDIEAARRHDGFKNRWFLDALFCGKYPVDIVDLMREYLEGIDLDAVSAAAVPVDFLGLNYYTRNHFIYSPDGGPLKADTVVATDGPFTAMGWEIYPDGLQELLVRVSSEYHPKAIYITENGAAFDDPAPLNGMVADPERADYLRQHFAAAEAAVAQGVPLKGYFVWSLLDNFEWAEGYRKRFGIIHVNYETQQRTPKQSGLFYRDFIQAQK